MQIVGKVHVPGRPRHQRKASSNKHGRHNSQAIKAVGQVDRIAGTDNHEVGQQNVEQAQLRHDVFKERHDQLRGGRIFAHQIQREGHA